jgi:hypothetical protein
MIVLMVLNKPNTQNIYLFILPIFCKHILSKETPKIKFIKQKPLLGISLSLKKENIDNSLLLYHRNKLQI